MARRDTAWQVNRGEDERRRPRRSRRAVGRRRPSGWRLPPEAAKRVPGRAGCYGRPGRRRSARPRAILHLTIISVSSQPAEKLWEAITANRLPQQLASDPTLSLAELLNLPTLRVRGERFYHRLTIVVVRRKITRVYYPVTIPGRHAAEVPARVQIAH